MWILGSVKKEMLFLYLPGCVSVLVAIMFPDLGETSLLYGLLATALIDSGHVYTTSWRTFFHPSEVKTSKAYFLIPVLTFLIFSSWHVSGMKGLWSFVVYATIYHHVRQVYGFSKWYQALNKRSDKISDFFLYALAVVPFAAYHFREGVVSSYYSDEDLFMFPDMNIFKAFIILYSMIAAGWIIYERRIWKEGKKEVNRVMSVGFPALVYGYCFLAGQTLSQVLFPLLFIHGVAYVGILSQTLQRTRALHFKTFYLSLMVVAFTAAVFGLGESWLETNLIATSNPSSYLTSILVGLWLTPLFCHYYFDAFIWKRNHRESKIVLGQLTD